jgi:hypothetical protein
MTNFKILCDINENISFNIGGVSKRVDISDLAIEDNIKRIYRIQFSQAPTTAYLFAALKAIESNPDIDLRFYGSYSEEQIEWGLLSSVERLQIDLWETKDLKQISQLTKLRRLGITKNVKSSVSLNILETLTNLQILFTSISKDIQVIGKLNNLHFVSLREIKTKNLDFLTQLEKLNTVWLSLGSYENFKAISQIKNLKRFSVHQVKGFDNINANEALANCDSLEALQFQDLKYIESFKFLTNLKQLKYLQIEGLKNIDSYDPILTCSSLETFLAYNSKPLDKSLKGLVNVKNVGLGDSYSKDEIDYLVSHFTGETIRIRAKEIKGKLNYTNLFDPMLAS